MVDQDVVGYLAGDRAAAVSAARRVQLDAIRVVLADPAMWVRPDPGLGERIVAGIAAERRSAAAGGVRRIRWIGPLLFGVAAALVIGVGVVVGVLQRPGDAAVTYAAELAGTPLAVQASGQATLTRTASGWRIELHAAGLPRRDGGNFYQAWLKSVAGVLVPVGTFNEPTQVTLWAGVSPADFPTLTVTQQQANGDPASSGRVVLKGTTHH